VEQKEIGVDEKRKKERKKRKE